MWSAFTAFLIAWFVLAPIVAGLFLIACAINPRGKGE